MNPAGIAFGPKASLNVGGSVTFTTADYLRLVDGVRFEALPGAQDVLLSAAPVAAFGFLGTTPATISIEGSSLAVPEGQSLSLIGGNISIHANPLEDAAHVTAAGGQIRLASIGSPGEVFYSTLEAGPNIQGQTSPNMGTITVSGNTTIDVSGESAGTVKIRGGNLILVDSTISADTGNANSAPLAIDIHVTEGLSMTGNNGVPVIAATTTGMGDAGEVRIVSGTFGAMSTFLEDATHIMIDSHSSGSGAAGRVNITAENLSVTGPSGNFLFIHSGPESSGKGADVAITAHSVELSGTAVSTGTQVAEIIGEEASGPAGHITITTDTFLSADAYLLATAGYPFETQLGGTIDINAVNIDMINSSVSAAGFGAGGGINITGDWITTDATQFDTFTALSPAGGITISGRVVELTNGSTVSTTTFGDGSAGDIHVAGTERVSILGITGTNLLGEFNPSGLFSNSLGFFGSEGNAGNISVTTPQLVLNEGRINTSTVSSGHGGNVTINAGTISISGEFPNSDLAEPFFTVTDVHPSGIFTRTVGSEFCAGPCGDAGNISITAASLTMGSGSQIDSGTSSSGRGGDTTITATNSIVISGTLTDGSPSGIFSLTIGADPGSGGGGNITLRTGSFQLSSGAVVSAASTSTGASGSITIQGTNSPANGVTIEGAGSGLFTSAEGEGPGGNISVNANTFTLRDGAMVSASTFGVVPEATGGTISIEGNEIRLDSFGFITADTSGAAPAGDISLAGDRVTLEQGFISSSTYGSGQGGAAMVTATDTISLLGGFMGTNASSFEADAGNGGRILLQAPTIHLEQFSGLTASTVGSGNAGDIQLWGQRITLAGDSIIDASTQGPGQGGSISIYGLAGPGARAQSVAVSGSSRLESRTSGDAGGEGPAGSIIVNTARFSLTDSQISTVSLFSPGDAGNIMVTASESVAVSQGTLTSSTESGLPEGFLTGNAGQITVSAPIVNLENQSVISTTTDSTGNAGTITIQAGALTVQGGSQIISSSEVGWSDSVPTGLGGSVVVRGLQGSGTAASTILIDGPGSGIFTNAEGSGAGGNITMLASNSVALKNRASISASSTGSGDAGSIFINAGKIFQMQDSFVTTESSQASGGNITIVAQDVAHLSNSLISTSVQGGPETIGGNIDIDPEFVILQNSKILAQAVQGQGGNIRITAGVFMMDALSEIDAQSEFGRSGEVTIQSPLSNLSASWLRLQQSYLEAAALLRQACAARLAAGESSLILTGRDRIPMEPGSWLSSPIALQGISGGGAVALAKASTLFNGETVSVRRYGISPVFYDITSAGCAS